MKPCDLTDKNWDVNVAVLELDDTEIRVTASATAIWFRCRTSIATVDVTIPIKVWRQIVSFVKSFTEAALDENCQTGFLSKNGKYEIMIVGGIVEYNWEKKTRKLVQTPLAIMVGQWPRTMESWKIQLPLSKFKKIVKWYNTDSK